jgi:lambda family phage portal protein
MAIYGQWLGGRTDRNETAGWLPFAGSADADDLSDLPTLRSRSRDLQRSEPIAKGAVNTVVTNTVATGLVYQSNIDRDTLNLSADEAAAWQRKAEREFRLWALNTRACDTRSQLNFAGLQELAMRSALESGDVFATLPMIERRGITYAVKVQLIEADRVCNKDGMLDQEGLAGGIKRNAAGEPVEYHILKSHPGSLLGMRREWDVIPAFGSKTGRRNVIHLMEMLRPEQSRGIPYLAPVIEPLRQLGKYTLAELNAAVVSSLLTVFVKTQGGVGLGIGGDGAPTSTTAKSGDNIKLKSGAIIDLNVGEDIVVPDLKRPNTAFDGFVLAVLRQVGVALELPFEVLVKHFTASYTAARAALLQAVKFFLKKREWLGTGFCDPILAAWMEEAVARGRLIAPGFFDDPAIRQAYLGCEWRGDAFGLLDPLKEAEAVEKWLELNLTTHKDEAARNFGTDWDTTAEQLGREQKAIDAAGLAPAPEPRNNTGAQPGGAPAPNTNSDIEVG